MGLKVAFQLIVFILLILYLRSCIWLLIFIYQDLRKFSSGWYILWNELPVSILILYFTGRFHANRVCCCTRMSWSGISCVILWENPLTTCFFNCNGLILWDSILWCVICLGQCQVKWCICSGLGERNLEIKIKRLFGILSQFVLFEMNVTYGCFGDVSSLDWKTVKIFFGLLLCNGAASNPLPNSISLPSCLSEML